MDKYRFIDLFAGIVGIRIPFDELGCECVFSAEIDTDACRTYEANFGINPYCDITKLDEHDLPDHEILLAGFPCQAFSIIGNRRGFEDARGTLFFDIARILAVKKPKTFLLENVKQLTTHDNGNTFRTILSILDDLGYHVHWKVLNALDYGLPQKRERIMIVGFRDDVPFDFPEPLESYPPLSSILMPNDEVDKSFFASERIVQKRMESMPNPRNPRPYGMRTRAGTSPHCRTHAHSEQVHRTTSS